MNKLTKLLSVLVVACVFGAGTAALAGCGGDSHTHTAVKHGKTEATCTEVGYSADYYTCDGEAGKYYSDEACTKEIELATITVAAKGHTEVVDAAVAATCTKAGKTEGKHCSVCNTVIVAQEAVAAKGHTEVNDAAVEPTCTEAGKTAGKHCSVCNTVIVAQEAVAAKGHTEVVDAAVDATCTEAGKTEGKHCSVCDAIIVAQEVVAAKGHTEVVDAAVAATCTEAGKTEGKHCSVCETVIKAQEVVPATGHTAGTAWESDATNHWNLCTAGDGEKMNVAAHTEVEDPAVAPTCTEAGKTAGKHCSVCNAVIVAQEEVPATGHTEVEDPAVAATCTEAGKTAGKHCSVCGTVTVAQEVVPATGHTEVEDPAVAATCTEAGKTAGKHCSVCNTVTVAQEEVPATGHTYVYTDKGDGTHSITCKLGDLTETTEAHVDTDSNSICDKCEYVIIVNGHSPALHKAVAATCTEDGYSADYYTCNESECAGKYYSDETCTTEIDLATITIKATGHTEVVDKAVEATCTETGLTEGKHCSVCETVLVAQKVVDAKGHTEVIDKGIEPTCTSSGISEGKHCSVCGTVLVAQIELIKEHTVVVDPAVAPTCTEDGKTAGSHCSECGKVIKAQEVVPATNHNPVKHEASEPTCSKDGNILYYTCENEAQDKYYSDEACTQELSAEEVVISTPGHKYEITPNWETTHLIQCSVCDEVDSEADKNCADADGDNKCDVCGGDVTYTKVIAGTYVNWFLAEEMVLTETTLTFGGETMTLSATENGVATCTGKTEYTLVANREGYTLKYMVSGLGMTEPTESDFVTKPEEELVTTKEAMVGVYTGELTYKDEGRTYKVTKFAIVNGTDIYGTPQKAGFIQFTEVEVGNAGPYYPVTNVHEIIYKDLYCNGVAVDPWLFVVTKAEGGVAKEITLSKSKDRISAVFTLSSEAVSEVPAALSLTHNLIYAADGFKLVAKSQWGQNTYTLNGDPIKLVSGDATQGYLVTKYTVDGGVSYLLKVNATANTVDLYASDGTTKLATLEVYVQDFPTLVADGTTVNNNAEVDEFNELYAYYTIGADGYYTFGNVTNNLKIYTTFVDGMPETYGAGVINVYPNFDSTAIYLRKGDKIAVDKEYATAGFVAKLSDTEPVVTFDGFAAERYGTYVYEGTNEWGDTLTYKFVISDVGLDYDYYGTSMPADFAGFNGTDYLFTNAYGGAVIFTFDADGNMSVSYDSLNYAQIAYVAVKSTDVGGGDNPGGGETGDTTLIVGINTINVTDNINGVLYTFTATEAGTYVVTFDGEIAYITTAGQFPQQVNSGTEYVLEANGTVELLCYMYDGSLSSGTYSLTIALAGDNPGGGETSDNTLIVGINTINVTDNINGVLYTFTATEAGTYTFTFDASAYITTAGQFPQQVNSGTEYVLEANGTVELLCYMYDGSLSSGTYTLTIALAGGEAPAPAFAGFSETQQGAYTYTFNNGRFDDTITLTLGATSVNYKSSATAEDGMDLTVTEANGVYTCESMIGNVVFSINVDGSLSVTEDVISNAAPYTATKGGTSTGGETSENALIVGINTINVTDNMNGVIYTFTATEAGEYTLTFDSTGDVIVESGNGSEQIMSGSKVNLAAGETISLLCYMSDWNATSGTYNLTIAKA